MRTALLVVLLLLSTAAPAAAATFAVDRDDDADIQTCSAAGFDCTLRGALTKANSTPDDDTITLPAMRIAVTSPLPRILGAGAAPGALTIQGAGARSSIIDGTHAVGSLIVNDFGSNTTLADLEVTGAKATPRQGDAAVAGAAVVERVAIIDNESTGLAVPNGTTITDSLIARNSGEGVGGLAAAGVTVLRNSTVADNLAVPANGSGLAMGPLVFGGGVVSTALLEIDHSTIAGNHVAPGSALLTGDNLGVLAQLDPAVIVRSSVIGGGLDGPSCGGPIASNGHNIDADGSCHLDGLGDRSDADPMLAPLANNGGPTDTMALLAGSPAIDAGDDCLGTDQRGSARALGASCDAGAFESSLTAPKPPAPPTNPPVISPPTVTTITTTTQTPPPPRDTTPPKLTVSGVAKSVTRKKLRAGLRVRVGANEPIDAELELLIFPRRVTIARSLDVALAAKRLPRAAGTRTVTLRPAVKLTGHGRISAQLRVVAHDAAGNRSTRTIAFTVT